jgi:O-methyltransferase
VSHALYAPADVGEFKGRNRLKRLLLSLLERRGIVPMRVIDDSEEQRSVGRDWPLFAQTMIGLRRLDNLHDCVVDVLERKVPGNLIEAGAWRGGATIFMRGILKAYDVTDRKVWVADSFEGLPRPDATRYPADAGSEWHLADLLAVSLEEVRENFRRYGLLDEQVVFLEGWFEDTLMTIPEPQWAVVRLDGDMYQSTMDALLALYPNLSVGGYLIVDDYDVENCRKAVHDFREQQGIRGAIQRIDWTGVYWQRSA